jgi:hypothetical protein
MYRKCPDLERVVDRLRRQLDLALELLKAAKQAREIVAREAEIVAAACNAYEHSLAALDRIPTLPSDYLSAIHRRLRNFRAALRELDQ